MNDVTLNPNRPLNLQVEEGGLASTSPRTALGDQPRADYTPTKLRIRTVECRRCQNLSWDRTMHCTQTLTLVQEPAYSITSSGWGPATYDYRCTSCGTKATKPQSRTLTQAIEFPPKFVGKPHIETSLTLLSELEADEVQHPQLVLSDPGAEVLPLI